MSKLIILFVLGSSFALAADQNNDGNYSAVDNESKFSKALPTSHSNKLILLHCLPYDGRYDHIDHGYEFGKALYTGRIVGVEKIDFCVQAKNSKKITKVKLSSLKAYKGGSTYDLATNLFNCEDYAERIKDRLTENQLSHVVYYLNKEHQLELSE